MMILLYALKILSNLIVLLLYYVLDRQCTDLKAHKKTRLALGDHVTYTFLQLWCGQMVR